MNDQVRAAIARSKAVRFDGDVRELLRVAHGDRRVLAKENDRLRKLLADLVDCVEAYRSCGSTSTPDAVRWGAELDTALAAAKNHIVDAAKIVEPEPGREECLKE